MVMLTVKGTKHADEFTLECSVKDLASDIAPKAAAIQNKRLSVKNQLSSAEELLPSARKAVAVNGRPASDAALALQYEANINAIREEMKNARVPVPEGQYDRHWNTLRDLTAAIFPNECTHPDDKDQQHEAAITQLYNLYENPDIDEDYRLLVYHCRCLMDPLWRIHEMVDVKKEVALWFNGRQIDRSTPIGTLCANNEKSRITVKVALAGGAAPSLEPRLGYEEQRELRKVFATKAEERKQLEESEMHEHLRRQRMISPAVAIGAIQKASDISSSQQASLKGGRMSETIVEGEQ